MTPPAEGRLALLPPELVTRICSAPSPQWLRRFAIACARLSLQRTGVHDSTIAEAAAMAEALEEPPVPSARWLAVRQEIGAAVDRLDDAAFDLRDRVDAGDLAYEEYAGAFRRARAVASLGFALAPDAATAAVESCYESVAATEDVDALLALAASLES